MKSEESVIVFSMDVDNVSDVILDWSLQLFRDNGLPVTVFATHKTAVLENTGDDVEIGIHPDFFGNDDHDQIINDLVLTYPDARGVRSHGLFEYSNLMNVYRKHNLVWDSSQLLYRCAHIKPYLHPSGLIRLPIFWEDDDYFSCNPDWEIEHLGLDTPGVKCFDFHPIHLRLNSHSPEQYAYVKERDFTRESIQEAEYKGTEKGTFIFLKNICSYIIKNNLKILSIGDVCSGINNE